MQDRFKFRVFLKYNQVVCDIDSYCFLQGLNKCVFHFTNGSQKTLKNDDFILMQSTGLKDKNGKLIYDGDIVNVYVSSEKLYRYQVKFEIGSFMLVSDGEIFDFPNKWNDNVYPLSQLYFEYENEDYCIEQLEVIGNIYENKEILNEI